MNQADLSAHHGTSTLVLPVPTLPFAMLVGLIDLFLLFGIGMALGSDLGSWTIMAANVAGSLMIYAALLCFLAAGDPRIWRHPARLRLFLASDRPLSDRDFTVMRAVIWQAGSVTIGRQAGCLAGLAAGASLSPRSDVLAALAFFIVGGAVWLLVSMLVSAPDRAELAPWVDLAEDRSEPDQSDIAR